jgi:hypothetical protein
LNLEIDLGLIKSIPIRSNGRKIMQIVQKKPKTTAVLKTNKLAKGQKTKQIDRHPDTQKNSICFKEFETANFETRNPKMTLINLPNSRTLTVSIYSPKKTGLTPLNLAEKNSPESGLELTKTGSLINIDRKTEACSSRSGMDPRNCA